MTFEGTDTCMKVLDLLCEKMEDPSAVVKYKALNVVKNVLQKGSPAFFQEMGRKHQVIRECLNFRGPPDPLRGDAPYSQVRDLAQQVINMIYDTQPSFNDASANSNPYALGAANASRGSFEPATQSPPPLSSLSSSSSQSSMSSSTSTFGAPPSSNYRVSTTYAGTTTDGGRRVYVNSPKAIGSYVEYQPSRFETMMDKVSESLDQFKTSLVGQTLAPAPTRPYAYGSGSSASVAPNLTYASRYTTADAALLDYSGDADVSKWTRSVASASPSAPKAHIPGLSRPTQEIIDGWEYKLVTEITPHTGRPAPARNEISAFISKASQLASSGALTAFIDALIVRIVVSEQWQCKLKALHLMEALLRANVGNARQLIQPHLTTLAQISTVAVQTAILEKIHAIIQTYPESERPTIQTFAAPAHDSTPTPPSQTGSIYDANTELLSQGQQGANGQEEGLFSGLNDRTAATPITTASLIAEDFSFLSSGSSTGLVNSEEHVGARRALPLSDHVSHPHPSVLISSSSSHAPVSMTPSSFSSPPFALFDGLDTTAEAPLTSASSSTRGLPSSVSIPAAEPNLLLDFSATSPTISNPISPDLSQPPTTSIERDFFSRPVSVMASSEPTATLRELQPSATMLSQNTSVKMMTTGRNDLDQVAILKGRLLAINDQLLLVRMQMPSPSRNEMEQQLEAQKKELEAQLERIEMKRTLTSAPTSFITATTTPQAHLGSPTMSLEALYRQQLAHNTAAPVDYSKLQMSHPVDPFDSIRHEIRK